MAFRLRRKCVNVEQEEYETKEKIYREHLDKIPNIDEDLWKYFYWDTFHDGRVEKISFGDYKPSTLASEITEQMNRPIIEKCKNDILVVQILKREKAILLSTY